MTTRNNNLKEKIEMLFFYILLIISIALIIFSVSSITRQEIVWKEHYVTESTLWEIANNLNLNQDIRETIYMIQEENNIKSNNLQIGQIIKVPTYKEN